MRKYRSGFSLVELSVVLVVIGLLAGGIVVGKNMMRAAQLRGIISEYQRFTGAVARFTDTYEQLPGDFNAAESLWGTAAACPGIFSTAAGGTCNGNGDNLIGTSAVRANEVFRFWQHLALAKMIDGDFSGVSSSGAATTYNAKADINVPSSRADNGAWFPQYLGEVEISHVSVFEGSYGNVLRVGGITAASAGGYLLTPKEAMSIDMKMDDGKPAIGDARTFESYGAADGTGCTDLAPSSTLPRTQSAYSIANRNQACTLVFKLIM